MSKEDEQSTDLNVHAIDSYPRKFHIDVIECQNKRDTCIEEIKAEADVPQEWNPELSVGHIEEAKLVRSKPAKGKVHTIGRAAYTKVVCNNQVAVALLDSGAHSSVVGMNYLTAFMPRWKEHLIPIFGHDFKGCG